MVRKCIPCQQFSGNMKRFAMLLHPISLEKPFTQWGLDFIGTINPKSIKGHIYILTTTYYFTKWKEAVVLKKDDFEELIKFLKDNILSRFCALEKFIIDNGSNFIGSSFANFCGEYGIFMGKSSNYYP